MIYNTFFLFDGIKDDLLYFSNSIFKIVPLREISIIKIINEFGMSSKSTARSRLWSQSIVLLPSLLTRRVNYLDWIRCDNAANARAWSTAVNTFSTSHGNIGLLFTIDNLTVVAESSKVFWDMENNSLKEQPVENTGLLPLFVIEKSSTLLFWSSLQMSTRTSWYFNNKDESRRRLICRLCHV